MKTFKGSNSRLVRLFQKSRETWKAKAAEKQRKIMALEYWKENYCPKKI